MKQYHWKISDWGSYTLCDPNGEEITWLNPTDAPEDITPDRGLAAITTELNRLTQNER